MFKFFKTAICLIIAAAVLLLPLAAPVYAMSPREQLELLREIDDIIAEYYIGSDGESRLPRDLRERDFDADMDRFNMELEKMLEDLDDYSGMISRLIYDMIFGPIDADVTETGPRQYGIGVIVGGRSAYGAYIESVVPGGAAEEAGLRPGDHIVAVNGDDTRAMHVNDTANILRGEEGTDVLVGIRRPGALEDEEYRLTRRALPQVMPYVTGYVMENGTGYIEISSFMGDEYDVQAFSLYAEHFRRRGVTELIIDLRGNGGGIVNETHEILNMLGGDEDETLFTFYERDGTETPFRYESGSGWSPERVIILVDEGTASASEIMAGSLRDRGRAILVGTQTFGKAVAQIIFELSSGDLLILTRYRIELPETGDYNGIGLAPDAAVELETFTLDMSDIAALEASQPLYSDAPPRRVLALEQCLWMLGYFRAEPDELFDAYTLHALNSFQIAEGIGAKDHACTETLREMEINVSLLEGKYYIPTDNQLNFALALLSFYDSLGAADDWARAELEEAAMNGFVFGFGDNAWQDAASRLHTAEALVRFIEAATGKTVFEIAAENDWDLDDSFADTDSAAAAFLKAAGISYGMGDGTFAPDSTCTRAQMMTFIGRAVESIFGADMYMYAGETTEFTDVPEWAAAYVNWAEYAGITRGVGNGLFDSEGILQYQHVGVMMQRAYELLNN